jgi:hypothetical protein
MEASADGGECRWRRVQVEASADGGECRWRRVQMETGVDGGECRWRPSPSVGHPEQAASQALSG